MLPISLSTAGKTTHPIAHDAQYSLCAMACPRFEDMGALRRMAGKCSARPLAPAGANGSLPARSPAGVRNARPAGRMRSSPIRSAGAVHAAGTRNRALVASVMTPAKWQGQRAWLSQIGIPVPGNARANKGSSGSIAGGAAGYGGVSSSLRTPQGAAASGIFDYLSGNAPSEYSEKEFGRALLLPTPSPSHAAAQTRAETVPRSR